MVGCSPRQEMEVVRADEYLVCVELPFLTEARRHVLGLGLLLGQVVLVEEMLVLNLTDRNIRFR